MRGANASRTRLHRLQRRDPESQIAGPQDDPSLAVSPSGIALYLAEAGIALPLPAAAALAASGIAAALVLASALSLPVLALFLPLLLCWGIAATLDSRRYNRSQQFNADFPSVALAMASSLRVGLSPLVALERSVSSLPHISLVRKEVERLNERLQKGIPPERAIQLFGAGVALAELDLFRRGFSLVLKHGGRFSPTLERLAQVGRDRASLIQAAQSSVATMKMTAHVLLAMTPFILFVMSFRRKGFWETFMTSPAAQMLGVLGLTVLTASYLALRWMSRLRL